MNYDLYRNLKRKQTFIQHIQLNFNSNNYG